jgi:signal transduction histidine kinase
MKIGAANKNLRILFLEDNPQDQLLVKETLAGDGLNCRLKCVANQNDFRLALNSDRFDLIISDFTLPSYDGMASFDCARKLQPETPFILVSGTIGEERVVEFLKGGAADCVLKENLSRLAPAIRRALREVDERAKRQQAEEELRTRSDELRALAARLQASREEERILISREIHDELGEALTTQKFGLSWLRDRLERRDKAEIPWEQLFAKMDTLSAHADATADRVRKLCAELRPSILDDLGLTAAIEWQAREFQTRTNIRCEVAAQDMEVADVGKEQATAVFRIFQEILTNVARHAHASKVWVSLKKTATKLILQVKDNGKGIADKEIVNQASLGILGMRERAMLLGGELVIHGKPARGTIVMVSIPLSQPAPKSTRSKSSP